jgi:hypothetical protein
VREPEWHSHCCSCGGKGCSRSSSHCRCSRICSSSRLAAVVKAASACSNRVGSSRSGARAVRYLVTWDLLWPCNQPRGCTILASSWKQASKHNTSIIRTLPGKHKHNRIKALQSAAQTKMLTFSSNWVHIGNQKYLLHVKTKELAYHLELDIPHSDPFLSIKTS